MKRYYPEDALNSIEHNSLNQRELNWISALKRKTYNSHHYDYWAWGFYNKKTGEVYCTCCHKTHKVEKGHNLSYFDDYTTVCPHCKQKMRMKTNNCTSVYDRFNVCFIRFFKNYVIVRHFHLFHNYNEFKSVEISYREFGRTIIELNKATRYNYEYHEYSSKFSTNSNSGWIKGRYHNSYLTGKWYYPGQTYTGNFSKLKGPLYYQLPLFLKKEVLSIDNDVIVERLLCCSLIERLYKSGFKQLSFELLHGLYDKKVLKQLSKLSVKQFVNMRTKEYFKLAMENDANFNDLSRYRKAEHLAVDFKLSQESALLLSEIYNIDNFVNTCKNIGVSLHKTLKYLNKQKTNIGDTSKNLISWYVDYIDMCVENGFDIKLHRINQPLNLSIAHDNMLDIKHYKKDSVLCDKYEKQAKKLVGLNKDIKGLQFIVPKNRVAFIRQGDALDQCVGRGSYFESMANGNSFIFFINKDNERYLTLEVFPNGSIGQCLGKRNRIKPTNEEIKIIETDFVKNLFLKNKLIRSIAI